MNVADSLLNGYFDEVKDYIVEIDTNKLKEWFKQENLDLLDFETKLDKKIAVYNILESELTKDIEDYQNFTVKFI